jgi:putative membrane protein
MTAPNRRIPRDVWLLLAVVGLATAWSLANPADYATWFFEIVPGGIGVVVLAAISSRFRFSSLLYAVVAIHFVVLAAGAKYTYAEMPLFNWLRDSLQLSRNYYDRIGHLFQGITVALLAREILIRYARIGRGTILGLLAVGMALAFSALYELVEWWWVILFYPDHGPQWLGMQGDPWDAQGDMFMALCGAVLVVVALSRLHDRSIRAVEGR